MADAGQPRPHMDLREMPVHVGESVAADSPLRQVQLHPAICGREISLHFGIRLTCDYVKPCPIHRDGR